MKNGVELLLCDSSDCYFRNSMHAKSFERQKRSSLFLNKCTVVLGDVKSVNILYYSRSLHITYYRRL